MSGMGSDFEVLTVLERGGGARCLGSEYMNSIGGFLRGFELPPSKAKAYHHHLVPGETGWVVPRTFPA